MIEVEHLSKSFGPVPAVRDISFTVERGDVVGFLGPNGAGKTTTLRMLAGFLSPTEGRVRVAGHDVAEQSLPARQHIGYMPEAFPLYPEMRVVEYLRFRAELKRVRRQRRSREVARAMGLAGAREMADVRIAHLSKGYRQRVGLADALLGSPPLLILDEPSAGLDPNQIRELRQLLRELSAQHTIVLSTHILSEVEATCDRALVLSQGELVAEGTLDELRQQRRRRCRLELVVGSGRERALAVLRADPAVTAAEAAAEVAELGQRFVVELDATDTEPSDDGMSVATVTERLVFALAEARIGVRRLNTVAASLEQVFSELTAHPAPDDDASATEEGP